MELPALALLGGYARGTFSSDASGDKTVGFALVRKKKTHATPLLRLHTRFLNSSPLHVFRV